MSDKSLERPYEPLGIGKIIGETFATMQRNILAVLILGGIPSFVSLMLTWMMLGAGFITGEINDDRQTYRTVSSSASFWSA